MASKLLSSLVAGSLILSSSVASAQAAGGALEPATESRLGTQGESQLRGGDPEVTTAVIFALIVFVIAIWINRDDNEVEVPPSP